MKTIIMSNGLRFRLNNHCVMSMKNYKKWKDGLYKQALWYFRLMMNKAELEVKLSKHTTMMEGLHGKRY